MATEKKYTVQVQTEGKIWPTVIQAGSRKEVPMPHETKYEIELRNDNPVQCDALVKVDGKIVGNFRIYANSAILLKRPEHVDQAFVFVAEKSDEAKQGAVQKDASDNGLITVVFTPDSSPPKKMEPAPRVPQFRSIIFDNIGIDDRNIVLQSLCERSETLEHASLRFSRGDTKDRSDRAPFSGTRFERGATVLGAVTNQKYYDATELENPDYRNQTTIEIRLVVAPSYSPLTASPLRPISNPVPPRLPANTVN